MASGIQDGIDGDARSKDQVGGNYNNTTEK